MVPHLTQHQGKVDAAKNFVTGSSKRGEICAGFASRHVNEDIANCGTVVSVHSQMFHDPIEWPVGFQKSVWLLQSIF